MKLQSLSALWNFSLGEPKPGRFSTAFDVGISRCSSFKNCPMLAIDKQMDHNGQLNAASIRVRILWAAEFDYAWAWGDNTK